MTFLVASIATTGCSGDDDTGPPSMHGGSGGTQAGSAGRGQGGQAAGGEAGESVGASGGATAGMTSSAEGGEAGEARQTSGGEGGEAGEGGATGGVGATAGFGTGGSHGGSSGTSAGGNAGLAGTGVGGSGVAGTSGGGVAGTNAGTGGTGGGDACSGVTCSGHGTCVVASGSASCACEPGYAQPGPDATACIDVDECATAHGGCDPRTTCTNLPGSRVCGNCPPTYGGSGDTGCVPITCGGAPDATCACIKVATDGDDALAVQSGGVLPFANIAPALDYAAAHADSPQKVCVAEGMTCGTQASYPGPTGTDLAMRNGISVYGNYEASGWSRCAEQGTWLAPLTGNGVYFGPTVTSSTTLDGFSVARFSADTTTAITLDGTHGAVVSNVDVGSAALGATTTYGVDAKNGANATLSGIVMTQQRIGNTTWSPPNQVGIRAVDSTIAVSNSDINLVGMTVYGGEPETVTGVWLDNAPDSALLDSRLMLEADVATVALHGSNVPGMVLDGSTFTVYSTMSSSAPRISAVTLSQASGLRWQSGGIGVNEPEVESALQLVDSPGVTLNVFVTVTSSFVNHGITIVNSPALKLDGSFSVKGGNFLGYDGIYVTGDAEDTILAGTLTSKWIMRGLTIDGCADQSPLVRTAVTAYSAIDLDAISVSGACAPTISASATVKLCDESGVCGEGGPSPLTLRAIHCQTPSLCTVDHASASVIGGLNRYGLRINSYAVACDSGACPSIVDTSASGLSQVVYQGQARFEGGGIIAPGAALIARNVVNGGCTGGDGVGLMVSSGRIENNVVTGPTCGANRLDRPSKAVGLRVTGKASVHSNTIDAGGALDCQDVTCYTYQWPGCDGTGIRDEGAAEYTNNIVLSTRCQQRSAFWMWSQPTDFGPILRNDALNYGAPLNAVAAYIRYGDGTPMAAVPIAVVGLKGVSGTVFDAPLVDASHHLQDGSPCIDAGSTLDVPLTDFEGDPRDQSPDIGADEWTIAQSPCYGVDCSNHGVCQNGTCVCDPTYVGTHCEERDQCAVDNGGCDPLTTCTAAMGNTVCGPCPDGYSGTGETGCVPLPCTSNPCQNGGTCTNTGGGTYNCGCPPNVTGPNCELVFTRVQVGNYFSCGLRSDGQILCWGANDMGQSTPPSGSFTTFSTGGRASCAVRTDGTLACWGYGPGVSAAPSGSFESVAMTEVGGCGLNGGAATCWGESLPAPSDAFSFITLGAGYGCGLHLDGTPACWGPAQGFTDVGQTTPPSGTFQTLSAATIATCGIRADGSLACWGDYSFDGQSPPSGAFKDIGLNGFDGCALGAGGDIVCWGYPFGTPPAGVFTSLSVGGDHACALGADHSIACWGGGAAGGLTPPY